MGPAAAFASGGRVSATRPLPRQAARMRRTGRARPTGGRACPRRATPLRQRPPAPVRPTGGPDGPAPAGTGPRATAGVPGAGAFATAPTTMRRRGAAIGASLSPTRRPPTWARRSTGWRSTPPACERKAARSCGPTWRAWRRCAKAAGSHPDSARASARRSTAGFPRRWRLRWRASRTCARKSPSSRRCAMAPRRLTSKGR